MDDKYMDTEKHTVLVSDAVEQFCLIERFTRQLCTVWKCMRTLKRYGEGKKTA